MNSIFYSIPKFQFDSKMNCQPRPHAEWAKPKWNVQDFDNHYQLEVALPGFDKSEVNLKFENDILTISAMKENKNTDKVFVSKEFSSRKRKLNLKFSESILADKIEARFEQGILSIVMHKKPVEKSTIEVK